MKKRGIKGEESPKKGGGLFAGEKLEKKKNVYNTLFGVILRPYMQETNPRIGSRSLT